MTGHPWTTTLPIFTTSSLPTVNFLFLLGVMAGVVFSGSAMAKGLPAVHVYGHVEIPLGNIIKDVMLIAMGVLSLVTTKKSLRESNGFNWFPIQEVAYLFFGIFMTIIPALAILKAGSAGARRHFSVDDRVGGFRAALDDAGIAPSELEIW